MELFASIGWTAAWRMAGGKFRLKGSLAWIELKPCDATSASAAIAEKYKAALDCYHTHKSVEQESSFVCQEI